jgi:hypothetical protein
MAGLGAQIRDFERLLGETQARAQARIIQEVGKRLIIRSPVKSGAFVSGWFYSFGTPSTAIGTSTSVRKVNGIDTIPVKPGNVTHFITNNSAYAWRLETGSSDQAPYGIVGLAETDFHGIVQMVATEENR